MDYKKLWIELLNFFSTTPKTGWGKNEIVNKMKEMELAAARKMEEKCKD